APASRSSKPCTRVSVMPSRSNATRTVATGSLACATGSASNSSRQDRAMRFMGRMVTAAVAGRSVRIGGAPGPAWRIAGRETLVAFHVHQFVFVELAVAVAVVFLQQVGRRLRGVGLARRVVGRGFGL